MTIGILDYGAGNLKNVCRAIEHLGYEYRLIASVAKFKDIDKLIIPGVGAFKVAMEQLIELSLVEPVKELAEKGVPILGICLGMQLLFDRSLEFGVTKGLGLIPGELALIPQQEIDGKRHKVPHIGWNELILDDSSSRIVEGLKTDDAVYFVHSYMAEKYAEENLVAHCVYGELTIPSIVQDRNVYGCQFHPEKSGDIGLSILNNFLGNT